MSEGTDVQASAPVETSQEDPVKNIKAEFQRKLDNMQSQTQAALKQINETNQKLFEQLNKSTTTQTVEDDDEFITNPKAAKQKLKAEVLNEVQAYQNQTQATLQARQSKYLELSQTFPELGNTSSELFRKTQDLVGDKNLTPEVLESAVFKAAYELGVKKSQGQEEFVGGSSRSGKSQSAPKSESSDMMLEFARHLKQPVDNPEYIKKLNETAQRTNWSKWR